MTTQNTDYSKTVFLPNTSFTMRGDLTQKEPGILEAWEKMDLYGKMLEKRRGAKPYVLHDGPPYANGHIHIGHAFNKILKDIIVKSRSMLGSYSPYVPGWDCHGLPIEQALLKEMFISGADPSHIIAEKDLGQVSDEEELVRAVDQVLAQNLSAIEDYKKGKQKALMFLLGKVMAATAGKANPQMVAEILRKRLAA